MQANISDSFAVIVPTDATGSLLHCASDVEIAIGSSGVAVKGGDADVASDAEQVDSLEISDAEDEVKKGDGRNGDRQRDPTESPRRNRGIGAPFGL